MRILAQGHYSAAIHGEPLPELKEAVKAATGQHVRRINRFIQLSLIGAGRCLQGRTLSADTAVHLTSGRGDLELTLDILAAMYEQGQPPKPLHFVNTVSNSACFYVAKAFGLQGRSQFATRRFAPLQSALQLAALDLQTGVDTVLLGCVDIATLPLDEHRERIGVAPDTRVGEGSHWLLLAAGETQAGDIGHISAVHTLDKKTDLADWLAARTVIGPLALGLGQYLNREQRDHLLNSVQQALPDTALQVFNPEAQHPWYDSQTGHVLCRFLEQSETRQLLLIDTDDSGRLSLMQVERA